MNRLPIDPNVCKHPDEALRYNHGSYAPSVGNNPQQGAAGMYCSDCRTVVTYVNDIQDFIHQRQTKYRLELGVLTIPVADPFGTLISVGSRVVYPRPKSRLGWGIVDAINHRSVTPREAALMPRITAPHHLKIKPTDRGDAWGFDRKKDGDRKAIGLGVHVAPFAVVLV